MPTVSLSKLKESVYSQIDDNTLFFTDTEVTWAINEAIRLGNLFCGWITGTLDAPNGGTTIADRVVYRVPYEMAVPQKVVFEGKELDKVGLFQLFRGWPDWMKDTTATTGDPVARWCPYALDRIILHPADAVGGGLLQITGIVTPDELVSDTDTISIPKTAITMIADYAAHIVQCKLGNVPLTQSMPMYRSYEALIKQYRIWSNYKQPNFWLDERAPE